MSEWNYNLEEAEPTYEILVSRYKAKEICGRSHTITEVIPGEADPDAQGKFVDIDGEHIENAYAWMPLPDPAPLPEGD
jgi:hypothetical protein